MTTILVYLACLLTPGPEASIRIASNVTGASYAELMHIARRESALRPIGEHPRDAGNSRRVFERAVAVGWLDRNCEYGDGGWSSRGTHGLMAAYHMRWLGLRCAPPEVFDIPIVSAFAAARKHNARCWRMTKRGREHNPDGAHGWCK